MDARSIIHVSSRLTQRSCVTIRALRLKRYFWVVWRKAELYDDIGVEIPSDLLAELDRIGDSLTAPAQAP
jgi:hypothetical protein